MVLKTSVGLSIYYCQVAMKTIFLCPPSNYTIITRIIALHVASFHVDLNLSDNQLQCFHKLYIIKNLILSKLACLNYILQEY